MWFYKLLGFLTCALISSSISSNVFEDRLDLAASMNDRAELAQLFDVVNTGERLIAVGVRGIIVISDNAGANWRQVPVPVSSDLLAIDFPSPDKGWVVGHDGVILHSDDGGLSWSKQFDGRIAEEQLAEYFNELKRSGSQIREYFFEDVQLNYANGAEQALLDVWFKDELVGYAVGSFGTIFATGDGGKTWDFWIDRVSSSQLLHLNEIDQVGNKVLIASERGLVFELDHKAKTFFPHETGYDGTLFNVVGLDETIVAFGLKGAAYRSEDAGGSWERISFPGAIVADAELVDGKVFVLSRTGEFFVSPDLKSEYVEPARNSGASASTGLTSFNGSLVTVGGNGIRIVDKKDILKESKPSFD